MELDFKEGSFQNPGDIRCEARDERDWVVAFSLV